MGTFKCDNCEYSTDRKDNFDRHLKIHSNDGSNQVECGICGNVVTPAALSRHIKTAYCRKFAESLNQNITMCIQDDVDPTSYIVRIEPVSCCENETVNDLARSILEDNADATSNAESVAPVVYCENGTANYLEQSVPEDVDATNTESVESLDYYAYDITDYLIEETVLAENECQ